MSLRIKCILAFQQTPQHYIQGKGPWHTSSLMRMKYMAQQQAENQAEMKDHRIWVSQVFHNPAPNKSTLWNSHLSDYHCSGITPEMKIHSTKAVATKKKEKITNLVEEHHHPLPTTILFLHPLLFTLRLIASWWLQLELLKPVIGLCMEWDFMVVF